MIRFMTPGDVGEVKALLDICFGASAWSEASILSQLEKPDSICYVAVDEESVIGYLAFEYIFGEGSIIELAVHPDYRRQGIARSLIQKAADDCDDLDVAYLEVRESNIPAISLYKSLGFTEIGRRRDYYKNPKEDAVIMQLIKKGGLD